MKVLIDGVDAFQCDAKTLSEAFDLLRQASQNLRQKAAQSFYIGQYVYFNSSKTGRKVIGQIDSINRVSISLHEIDKTWIKWRVSASLLHLYNGEEK